jgi:hypothetical protein
MNDEHLSMQSVQFAIEDLLRLAKRRGIIVCGFAFTNNPPAVINFGNCADAAESKLYETLADVCKVQRAKGMVKKVSVEDVN